MNTKVVPFQNEKIDPPSEPGEWSIEQIERALSRPLPDSMLQNKPKKNNKTGKTTHLPFIPWYRVNRVLSKYAPGWSGRVVSVQQVGQELVLTYEIEIPTKHGAVVRQATGSESLNCGSFGEVAANAESQAFRRACARFGLGLYLYDR